MTGRDSEVYCVNCRHYKRGEDSHLCLGIRSLVTGETYGSVACAAARGNQLPEYSTRCGPEALLFEKR